MLKNTLLLFVLFSMSCCRDAKNRSSDLEKELLVSNFLLNISFRNTVSIDYEDRILIDTNHKSFSFQELFNEKQEERILFFRYDTKSCSLCLDAEMKNLSKLKEGYLKNVVLLILSNNINEFKIIKNRYRHGNIDIYSLKESHQFFPDIENKLLPYYFVASVDQQVKMPFIPDKNLPFLSFSYLNYIFDK